MVIVDLITGGYLAQLILLVFVWGSIAVLVIQHNPIPDPLLDAGFLILGFYFHASINEIAKRYSSSNRVVDSSEVNDEP